MDPAQWLADYRDRLERAARGARQARESLQESGATARSPRGEVTVSVNAAGVLEGVTLTPMARKLEADALAGLIVNTAREAQCLAAERMAEVMAGYLGDSPALTQLTQHLPAEVVR
ncbi:YbaB/EbfC family nucleoid-associated protein [Amycolatopsis cihanbeyliensis]|uniref:YbaB/EbfC DNA-binding family protein n=1 Tax=Amycolatopsis cihanbeyliensis TaxID=1128664 RepID=A0A542DD40_AMYCI|nr:YbaB/EbfC family nucleoid-associated protein [Amycolatopsis cihanbeyliensis]TQJ00990.1 YbaB/EbfC DNA-binding family protein [Amycolatopsis cihanbeyliensis]